MPYRRSCPLILHVTGRLARVLGLAALLPARAALAAVLPGGDIYELPLAALLEIEIPVSSLSRRQQLLGETAAAVHVLNAEDIRRSSALHLPDLLRSVPGLEVARIDSNKWAISARGFNGRLASKLLLVVDGRTIYSSTFGSVLWENEEIPLENIERIEVIRGPGASIWGANAVNGVVSITTKSAGAEQGSALSVTSGSRHRGRTWFRHNRFVGLHTQLKTYGSFAEVKDTPALDGRSADDDWRSRRLGFRLDSAPSPADSLLLQGEWHKQEFGQRIGEALTSPVDGRNFLDESRQRGLMLQGRWRRSHGESSATTAQFFYDQETRRETLIHEDMATYDVELYHDTRLGRHALTLGAGARLVRHDSESTEQLRYVPAREDLKIYNLAFYDDVRLAPGSILGLGLKLENNHYTGSEYQANLRFSQQVGGGQLWAALSRAVRTPSRFERDGVITLAIFPGAASPLDLQLELQPGELDIERMEGLELGWRQSFSGGLFLDVSSFLNRYSDLRNGAFGQAYCLPEPLCGPASTALVQPLSIINADRATTYGAELLLQWEASEALSVEASYTYLDMHYRAGPEGVLNDQSGVTPNLDNPLDKLVLQADWHPSASIGLNLSYRQVSAPGNNGVPGYRVLDFKGRWAARKGLELSLLGRNLGQGDHQEFVDPLLAAGPALVEPSWHLGLRLDW